MTRARLNKDHGDVAAMAHGFAEHFDQVNNVVSLVFSHGRRVAMPTSAGDLGEGGREGKQ